MFEKSQARIHGAGGDENEILYIAMNDPFKVYYLSFCQGTRFWMKGGGSVELGKIGDEILGLLQ